MKILDKKLKRAFPAVLLLAAMLLQNCKKDTGNTPAAPTKQGMYALINDTAWTAATVTAVLQYDQYSAGKTFTCEATMGDKIIQFTAAQFNVSSNANFSTGRINNNYYNFDYFIQPSPNAAFNEQKTTQGTTPGASLVITAIDTAKLLISGTFSFASQCNTYDANGNIISARNNQITNGVFNQVSYTYMPYLIEPWGY